MMNMYTLLFKDVEDSILICICNLLKKQNRIIESGFLCWQRKIITILEQPESTQSQAQALHKF